ncbi:transcription repressor NadR [Anaerotignum lactatifermentans]|uniref:Transcription repressor NadR n=1 Tax=Anaerotignum lactatifermentans TaxID=160404 RepID=A0ABS2GBQ5_9FIRM|nr:transcription repressor NadR [Anaerotignum lactatifermentans]MBM6828517.1 transcription repressor NadR [Anaerotignum lactatifermentans]MBM6877924.1 transcription repressor NadR [Anaerotignum lactatifermentans]MBM6950099.1 transcription repressor NadR [Anaerotignum lactatifermentans]
MKSEERRQKIKEMLENSTQPLSGKTLADTFGVTRQVIVKDMGIIKAEGMKIIPTARGYLLEKNTDNLKKREIQVCHSKEEIEKELQIIVDLGGNILQTHVNHPIYGTVGESLNIKSRKDIMDFLHKTEETGCMPLLELTKGVHTHLIAAEEETTLDEICTALKKTGFLLSQ